MTRRRTIMPRHWLIFAVAPLLCFVGIIVASNIARQLAPPTVARPVDPCPVHIPEPGTWALVGTGLVVLGLVRGGRR